MQPPPRQWGSALPTTGGRAVRPRRPTSGKCGPVLRTPGRGGHCCPLAGKAPEWGLSGCNSPQPPVYLVFTEPVPSRPAVWCPRTTATLGPPGASSPQDPGFRGQDGRHRPGAEEGGSPKFTPHTQFAGLQSTYHSPATSTSTALGENPEFPGRSHQTRACPVCSPAPGAHNAQRAPSTSSCNTNVRAPVCATRVPALISKGERDHKTAGDKGGCQLGRLAEA